MPVVAAVEGRVQGRGGAGIRRTGQDVPGLVRIFAGDVARATAAKRAAMSGVSAVVIAGMASSRASGAAERPA